VILEGNAQVAWSFHAYDSLPGTSPVPADRRRLRVGTPYRHTQIGRAVLWAMVPGPIALVIAWWLTGRLVLLALAVLLGLFGYGFSTLTIEVTAGELVWFFGPGIWRKTVELRDIASATVETNKWWWGWGIHLTPRGWLYNVGGLEAVEVTLKDGTRFRLGSDEPETFASALQTQIGRA
jgi:hypothetical protein